ncbi:hypothetical protein BDM02DRAFT_3107293 [Thelephora ganbajun]|uniref:Uncharacterized protein n=1 Tax=Thelephora ganbajun TaxID=370292 RepID=A0ACB6ZWL7_THEGA|nr:hypothetical protein BDM02DRAFT_3107293 [Thelephora ganbajun]
MSTSSPIPTQPTLAPQPMPSEASGKLQVPQFGGSPVGFWVLIVSLALIVIICCIAIFWLLKNHEPTPAERARRRAKLDAEKAAVEAVSTGEHSSNPRSFKQRIGRFFGRSGWTKANDDIEIQKTSSDHPDWKTEGDKEESDPPYIPTTRSGYGGVPSDQRHEYHHDSRMSSTSTVQLSAPSPEHTPIISRGVDLPFEPPYRSESPQPGLSPPLSVAPSMYERPHQDEWNFSVVSGDRTTPMRKLRNGTKFMEQV